MNGERELFCGMPREKLLERSEDQERLAAKIPRNRHGDPVNDEFRELERKLGTFRFCPNELKFFAQEIELFYQKKEDRRKAREAKKKAEEEDPEKKKWKE